MALWMMGSLAWVAICASWLLAHPAKFTTFRFLAMAGPTILLGLAAVAAILISVGLEAK